MCSNVFNCVHIAVCVCVYSMCNNVMLLCAYSCVFVCTARAVMLCSCVHMAVCLCVQHVQ